MMSARSARPLAGLAQVAGLALLGCGTFVFALALREDFDPSAVPWEAALAWLPVVFTARAFTFGVLGARRWILRSVTMHDLLLTLRAVVGGGLLLLAANVAGRMLGLNAAVGLPFAVLLADSGALIMALGSIRISGRLQGSRDPLWREARRVLIVGAGESGTALANQMRASAAYGLLPVVFVDDDPQKQGRIISGLRVAGPCDEIPTIVGGYAIHLVIIAMPSATPARIRDVVMLCQESEAPFRIVPSPLELVDGAVSLQRVRDIDLTDLLGRPTARIDHTVLQRAITGKRVLVTGAGGSVGSELARQVARLKPDALLLLDINENALFFTDVALRSSVPLLDVSSRIVDLTVPSDVLRIFNEFAPDVVLHAAAHKHVGLMEDVPGEAIRNNIGGILNVVEAVAATGVETFVFVSTDKAVAPTSVMGATKALGERIVQEVAKRSRTRFLIVRFGNVLGSNGSVVPIFQQQIAAGGPVTVTHPDMERFFMTTPEAAGLILEVAAVGQTGEIYVLDMGEPLKIVTLAETMIRLSGHLPYRGVPIVFTGARPGEKLTEELVLTGGTCEPTPYEKLLRVSEPDPGPAIASARGLLQDLPLLDGPTTRARLMSLVGGTAEPAAIPVTEEPAGR